MKIQILDNQTNPVADAIHEVTLKSSVTYTGTHWYTVSQVKRTPFTLPGGTEFRPHKIEQYASGKSRVVGSIRNDRGNWTSSLMNINIKILD